MANAIFSFSYLFCFFYDMIFLGDNMFNQMYEKIKNSKNIYIYRHVASDQDALGSQYGLKQIILDNFNDKHVVCMGEVNPDLFKSMHIEDSKHEFEKLENSLAIVLDTANVNRIDGLGFDLCDDLIKVDHHIIVESYGNLNIEDPTASSASELVVRFYEANKNNLKLSKEAASLLFIGIVGDTNRFMYDGANNKTHLCTATLLETGINKEEIFRDIYVRPMKSLEVQKFILNHFVFDEGVAYYILNQEDLDLLGISREQGSNYVHTLSDIDEIKVWMAITYQKEKDNYRVSLRSRNIPVQPTAAKFNGGGHIYASGATLNTLDDLDILISSLKEAINHAF